MGRSGAGRLEQAGRRRRDASPISRAGGPRKAHGALRSNVAANCDPCIEDDQGLSHEKNMQGGAAMMRGETRRRLLGAVGVGYGTGGAAGIAVGLACACLSAALATAWLGGAAATFAVATALAHVAIRDRAETLGAGLAGTRDLR
jgi:hypothetical protein